MTVFRHGWVEGGFFLIKEERVDLRGGEISGSSVC